MPDRKRETKTPERKYAVPIEIVERIRSIAVCAYSIKRTKRVQPEKNNNAAHGIE